MTQIERARGSLTGFILFASMAVAGCHGDTHPQVPTTFNKLTDNQQATVGTAVPLPPTVSILDADGKGIPGIQVTFALASGGGSLVGTTATTNSDGVATAGKWTLGTTAGTNTMTAAAVSVPGSPVTLTALGTAAAAASIVKVSTDPVSAPAGSNVDSIVVKVVDQYGNPVTGAAITFAVGSGGGSVSPTTVATGANGLAAARWTIGTTPNTSNTATATCAGLTSTITFSLTSGLAVAAVRFSAPSYVVDSNATITPAVSALDPQGNPISGAGITLTSRSASTATTGSGGTVTASHTGQTFIVATSNDNPNAMDSALVIVANIGSPVVIATIPRFDLKTDTVFTVPIIIDMRASTEKVGAATLQLTWDPTVLIYQSNAPGATVPDGDMVINTGATLSGSLTMTFADGTGFPGVVQVRTVTFKAATLAAKIGSLQITATDLTAASTLNNLLPKTVTSFYPFRTR